MPKSPATSTVKATISEGSQENPTTHTTDIAALAEEENQGEVDTESHNGEPKIPYKRQAKLVRLKNSFLDRVTEMKSKSLAVTRMATDSLKEISERDRRRPLLRKRKKLLG